MRRSFQTISLTLVSLLLLASPAFAVGPIDNGEGLVGETTDKVITFFSLGVVLFFTLFIILMSWVQGTLEKRKAARKAAHLRGRIGW
jgi:hypothetical protein